MTQNAQSNLKPAATQPYSMSENLMELLFGLSHFPIRPPKLNGAVFNFFIFQVEKKKKDLWNMAP